eukprot:2759838-Amphidinium_carterae.1
MSHILYLIRGLLDGRVLLTWRARSSYQRVLAWECQAKDSIAPFEARQSMPRCCSAVRLQSRE